MVAFTGTTGPMMHLNLFADPKGSIKTGSIYVNSMVEDDKKNLWMSTSVGILRLDSKRDDIRIYGKNRGVDVVNFIFILSAYKGFNGALNFGAASGFYNFFPDSLSGNSRPPANSIYGFLPGE